MFASVSFHNQVNSELGNCQVTAQDGWFAPEHWNTKSIIRYNYLTSFNIPITTKGAV
jgi:hypothetical protein